MSKRWERTLCAKGRVSSSYGRREKGKGCEKQESGASGGAAASAFHAEVAIAN